MLETALAWTLLHSLWQGVVVGVGLALALAVMTKAEQRARAAALSLGALGLAFVVTLGIVWPQEPGVARVVRSTGANGVAGSGMVVEGFAYEAMLPYVVPGWMLGAGLVLVWRVMGWWMVRRMQRTGVCVVTPEWQERLARLRERMGVTRTVELLESSLAQVPVVVGHLRPVILMPLGLLANLPVEQVEAILLHELAHVRRADYLLGMLASVVETLLFYHPVVWWMARRWRMESEHSCDDLAVEVLGDAGRYAAALIELETLSGLSHQPAVAATGGDLMQRIERILAPQKGTRAPMGWLVSGALLLTLTAVLAMGQAAKPLPEGSPYQKWVTVDVVYIIEPAEKEAFLKLKSDEEREQFIKQFWERRNPTPGNPGNDVRDEHYRRIGYANAKYGGKVAGWKTDRGRVYIVNGPPDEIEVHPNRGTEMWLYRSLKGVGENAVFTFSDAGHPGEYTQQGPPTLIKK